ncbi:DUF2586 family protein [Flavobacterium sp. N1994]|uniref:DUF2586 family protein n=1 Tax=Flavobacterium sp. N1994 TaxID=2986827 RepID=UPI00222365FF|nr:DUF2586 family protein [Flavobacterium sp. N1994]
MSLPTININISSNGLELSIADIQKIPGLVITGATVSGANKVTAGTSYQIFSLQEAVNLGIEETGTNAFAYKHIAAFYEKAKKGAELWFMVVTAATTMEDMADIENPFAQKLLADSQGKVRVLGIIKKSGTTETISNGVDADVDLAVIKAQALASDYSSRYYPVRIIISGNKFNGNVADLKDYTTTENEKVAILLANNDGSKEGSIGMLLGRLASDPVQRKISRVKNGAVEPTAAYFTNGEKVETLDTAWNAIDNKGYIFLRSFANRSGYYFTSDRTLTKPDNDFKSLARGLVMDKAVLITYGVLVDELSDEVLAAANGTIHPAIIKTWQHNIENNLDQLMVQTKELSGAKAKIDANQAVLQTDNINVELRLLPVGYSDFITVNIGFTLNLE